MLKYWHTYNPPRFEVLEHEYMEHIAELTQLCDEYGVAVVAIAQDYIKIKDFPRLESLVESYVDSYDSTYEAIESALTMQGMPRHHEHNSLLPEQLIELYQDKLSCTLINSNYYDEGVLLFKS